MRDPTYEEYIATLKKQPRIKELIFEYYVRIGFFNPEPAAALATPRKLRNKDQIGQLSLARMHFNEGMENPEGAQYLINGYFYGAYPDYKSGVDFKKDAKKALPFALGGLALIVSSAFIDNETGKAAAKVLSGIGGAAAVYQMLKAYVVNYSPIKF
jgi:hypothetical protein